MHAKLYQLPQLVVLGQRINIGHSLTAEPERCSYGLCIRNPWAAVCSGPLEYVQSTGRHRVRARGFVPEAAVAPCPHKHLKLFPQGIPRTYGTVPGAAIYP